MSESRILSGEAEMYVESLRMFEIEEIGGSSWMRQHEYLEKLNIQAILNASADEDEFVKSFIVSHGKVPVLITDLLCTEVWKEKIFTELLEMKFEPKTTFPLYMVFYHEATLVNLLETTLFYSEMSEAAEDSLLDLIDYCYRKLVDLINRTFTLGRRTRSPGGGQMTPGLGPAHVYDENKSYDCHRGNDNRFDPIYTTGSKVSFKLIRSRIDVDANYEIRIIAETVQAVITGGGGWNTRLDRGDETVRKFDTDIIIILMSTGFLLAFLIYAIVLAIHWKQRNKDTNKWTERPMGYDNPGLAETNSQTLAYVEQIKSHPPDDPRGQTMTTFTKMNGRPQPPNYHTRMAQSSIDGDSVFEGEKGMKRRLDSSNGRITNEIHHNAAYQQTPVRSRLRSSNRNASTSYPTKKSDSPASSDMPSSLQDNRRSQPKPKPKRKVDPEPTPSDSEDEVEQTSTGVNTDPELTDQGVQCEAEEEPPKPPPSPKPSTTTTSVGVGGSPVLNVHRRSPLPKQSHRPPSYEEALSESEYPAMSPKPRSSPRPLEQPRVPYVHYSNPTLRRPQPVYSHDQERRPYTPDFSQPNPGSDNSIPVYSYLVNRGYHIDDGQSSCGGTSHDSRIDHSNDSDFANLECGVELMRR